MARQDETMVRRMTRLPEKLVRFWHVGTQARRHVNHAGTQARGHVTHAGTRFS